MDIDEESNNLLNQEYAENEKEEQLIRMNREVNHLNKTTNDLEIANINLEKKISDAKIESAKLLAEVKLYDRLIDVTKDQVKNTLDNVNVEKNKLDEIQTEVWNDMQHFSESTMEMLQDEKFDVISNKCDEDLRTMEKEIIKLAGELEAMNKITEAQEKKIQEIKRITEKHLDDFEDN